MCCKIWTVSSQVGASQKNLQTDTMERYGREVGKNSGTNFEKLDRRQFKKKMNRNFPNERYANCRF